MMKDLALLVRTLQNTFGLLAKNNWPRLLLNQYPVSLCSLVGLKKLRDARIVEHRIITKSDTIRCFKIILVQIEFILKIIEKCV